MPEYRFSILFSVSCCRIHKHISAPKRHLPGHAESYNPPPEYIFDKKEMKEWNKQQNSPWKRKLHFVPQKYGTLREVPAYPRYIKVTSDI